MNRTDKFFAWMALTILVVFIVAVCVAITGCAGATSNPETIAAVDCFSEINAAIQTSKTCPDGIEAATRVYQKYPNCAGALERGGLRLVCHDVGADGGPDGAR